MGSIFYAGKKVLYFTDFLVEGVVANEGGSQIGYFTLLPMFLFPFLENALYLYLFHSHENYTFS